MISPLRNFVWMTALALMFACAGVPTKWTQFHGNLSSQGFQEVNGVFALSSAWVSKPYKITSSSIVLGNDFIGKKNLYVGTTDAHLVAINSDDGSEEWNVLMGTGGITRIVSSPAVSERGDIYVITNREIAEGRTRSTLHKVDVSGKPKWSYAFPDNGFTSSSPKVVTSAEHTLIFVYALVGMINDIQGELFVLQDAGKQAELLDRKPLDQCRFGIGGGAPELADIFGFLKNAWNFTTVFPVKFNPGGTALPDIFVDPSPAVMAGKQKMLIAIADNLCSLGAYEWNGKQLSVIWYEKHDFKKHSSTLLLPNGLMVFGRNDGRVFAYDADTGIKMWEYDAGEPVLATPAAPPDKLIVVVSKNHVQVLNAVDGTLIHDGHYPRKLELPEPTHASPAVTSNRIYVSTGEMLTVTYDLKTRGHDTNFRGNGLSSVAVDRKGNVFAVADDGSIRKYQGAE
jgi:outer membrane protein assembly factor BamB